METPSLIERGRGDDVDGEVDVAVTGTVDSSSIQTFVLTYTAVDSSGNQAQLQNPCGHRSSARGRNPPAVPSGSGFMVVDLGSTFEDPGATAVDTVDGVVAYLPMAALTRHLRVTYTILPASDSAGNQAVPATRVVEVVGVDDVAPVIRAQRVWPVELTVGKCLTTQGDSHLTMSMTPWCHLLWIGGYGDDYGFYAITYNATDDAGNDATPAVRVVYVEANSGAGGPSARRGCEANGAPDITLLGASSIEITL